MDPDDVSTPTNEVNRDWDLDKTPKRRPLPETLTAQQVLIKVVGQAPPHPEAAGVPVTPPVDPYRREYKFDDQIQQPVIMPIVVSKPPPHRRVPHPDDGEVSDISSDEINTLDIGLGEGRHWIRVNFEVSVGHGEIGEGEEVRITGSLPSLGKWNVFRSIKLQKSTEHDGIWTVELEVPSERIIKYRYLITRPATPDSQSVFTIVSWETFLGPRKCSFKKPRSSDETHTESVKYGISDVGERSQIEAGWLVSTSELHLQLGTLGASISLTDYPQHTHYLITVQPFSLHSSKSLECSPIKTKLLNRTAGDSVTFDLGSGTCPYNQQNNLVIFTTESVDFQNTGFSIDLYTYSHATSSLSLPVPLSPTDSKVGRASLLPQQYLGDRTQGRIVLTVFSEKLMPVGTVSLSYLLIHPMFEPPSLLHSTKHTYSTHWKKHKRMLHIGHRGLGDSHHQHAQLHPTETENTIASLKMAGNHGADYVEFDVHLTKDHVPIVYHNFLVCTTLAREGFFSGELYAMEIKDLTLQQLHSLKLNHSSALQKQLATLHVGGHSSSASDQESSSEMWGAKREPRHRPSLPERKTFPTLRKLFQSLPKHIGFDIEIKYPLPERDEHGNMVKDFSCYDVNVFVDTILRDVYQYARERKIMFTCFNPDICTLLRRKQHRYPVMFLTCAMNPDYGVSVDVRGHTLNDASMHAQAHHLLGIVPNSTPLLQNPNLIQRVKDKGLVLFTWGNENNIVENIETQKHAGVDAVIHDYINYLLPGPQKNIFQLEQEEKKNKQNGRT